MNDNFFTVILWYNNNNKNNNNNNNNNNRKLTDMDVCPNVSNILLQAAKAATYPLSCVSYQGMLALRSTPVRC